MKFVMANKLLYIQPPLCVILHETDIFVLELKYGESYEIELWRKFTYLQFDEHISFSFCEKLLIRNVTPRKQLAFRRARISWSIVHGPAVFH